MPNHHIKTFWNIVLILLLVYTATLMPFNICFIDNPSPSSVAFDNAVNILFGLDIFINFLSAIENSDGTVITKPKLIAQEYAKSWLALDVSSVIPVTNITDLLP